MWQIFHNQRCSKSRGAIEYLDNNKIDYEVINYLETPLTLDILKEILHKLELTVDEVIRRNEVEFKAIETDWNDYSEEEKLIFIITHPIVLQRPIVIHGNRAVIARPAADEIEKIK